ncbi:hypothetical protein VTO73DRAFT_12733 [Trametes versicolor]
MNLDRASSVKNIAYRQNAPGLEPARAAGDDVDIPVLTAEDVKKRVTKWDMYDALFKQLKEDALLLYTQFEVKETTIDAMVWPADSYAKTQIYKLEHFLSLYHEGRCRELVDMLKTLLALLREVYGEEWANTLRSKLASLEV